MGQFASRSPLAATQLKAVISIAPPSYNVPAHLKENAQSLYDENILRDDILVHYHWLLAEEHLVKDTLLYGSEALPASTVEWLKRSLVQTI